MLHGSSQADCSVPFAAAPLIARAFSCLARICSPACHVDAVPATCPDRTARAASWTKRAETRCSLRGPPPTLEQRQRQRRPQQNSRQGRESCLPPSWTSYVRQARVASFHASASCTGKLSFLPESTVSRFRRCSQPGMPSVLAGGNCLPSRGRHRQAARFSGAPAGA